MIKRLSIGFVFLFFLTQNLYSYTPESFSKLVKKVEKSVVNISTTQIIKVQRPLPFDFFREFFGEDPFFFNRPQNFQRQSLGSGVIISEDGYILTNNHVIKDANIIKIKLYGSKEEFDAKVIGKDPKIDIALLKIDAKKPLPFAPLGDSDELEVGDWVIAIGNPFGLSHTVTKGIVSAKGRVIGSGPYDDFIQTDAPINFGNSGGPLFNLKGEIVGINTAIISGGQGIGFAVPINMVKAVLPQLKEGKIVRAWLGVRIQPITKEIMESFGLDSIEGALIAEVLKNSPAEKAGLKEGDVIIEVDGKKVEDSNHLPKIIAFYQPEQKVEIVYIRDKKKTKVQVTLGKTGDTEEISPILEKIGIKVAETKEGVIVEDVQPFSLAQTAGISQGDYITRVNNQKVETLESFTKIISSIPSNSAVTIQLKTKGGNKFVSFRMP
jgi:serine protease Do